MKMEEDGMIDNLKKQVNKNSWFWLAPEYFSKWRVFPRGFIIVYFWLIVETALWFMGLPTPSTAQAAFASAIIGAGAAWFGLYVNSGNSNDNTTAMSPYLRAAVETQREVTALAKEQPKSELDVTTTTTYRPRVVAKAQVDTPPPSKMTVAEG
jgi:hypothetical protein